MQVGSRARAYFDNSLFRFYSTVVKCASQLASRQHRRYLLWCLNHSTTTAQCIFHIKRVYINSNKSQPRLKPKPKTRITYIIDALSNVHYYYGHLELHFFVMHENCNCLKNNLGILCIFCVGVLFYYLEAIKRS